LDNTSKGVSAPDSTSNFHVAVHSSNMTAKVCQQKSVGRSDMNKGQMLKESHTYKKRPT
jgi:hypothetical protein